MYYHLEELKKVIKRHKESKDRTQMTRVKRGYIARRRRNKIINFAKGFIGSHRKLFTAANQQTMKAFRYSYNDRRKKKNNFRLLWIKRINIACKRKRLKYSEAMNKLKNFKMIFNKKILASFIVHDYEIFNKIFDQKFKTLIKN